MRPDVDTGIERERLTGRLTRRGLLRVSALAGIGTVAGWLAWPEKAVALLCPCDTWNCGMFSPLALNEGGRTVTLYVHAYAIGETSAPLRVVATQESSGVVTEEQVTLTGDSGSGSDPVLAGVSGPEDDPELRIWTVTLTAPETTQFEAGDIHLDCWLEPQGSDPYQWQSDLQIVRFGANEPFRRNWLRTDKPVWAGAASRTWMWGPNAFTDALTEEYAESPGGQRTVQYYDKSRMEITHPDEDSESIWYVSNGLLVTELITGRLQTGDNAFIEREPAQINVAGDEDDPDGPTYATFGALLDAAPLASGALITQRIDRAGNISDDPALAAQNATVALVDDVTNHAIATQFWEFMNSSGTVWEDGALVNANLFVNPYYATGRPISEPYWADIEVAGVAQSVLLQCFERRCLTYTPGNDPGWQVEAGNVGRHYYAWRYSEE